TGTRGDEAQIRDAYDKGCAEARRILRIWIAEIKRHGIAAPPPHASPSTPATTPSMPVVNQDHDAEAPAPAEPPPAIRLKDIRVLSPPMPRVGSGPSVPEIQAPPAPEPAPPAPRSRKKSNAGDLLGRSIADAIHQAKREPADVSAPAPRRDAGGFASAAH